MMLHQDFNLYSTFLRATAQQLDIKLELVEKDYWISLVLSRLAKSAYVDACVFKGGTSLSKGYRLLDRLYVLPAAVGFARRKKKKGIARKAAKPQRACPHACRRQAVAD